MQRAIDADVSLEILAVKGIALAAAMPIEKDALVAQYVGKVLSRAMYLDREEKLSCCYGCRRWYSPRANWL
ncbi:hypothetical protein JG687_00013702 [Phytophthora cactorum]|uniref:Uncharacterized protein n=1 Tax=Phytophthora cactorum TaxID=29920 RepID=A0A8T1TYP1_9STRA|nr:hypothetical protein JG687_00013702 [Phytophthora cactorum]